MTGVDITALFQLLPSLTKMATDLAAATDATKRQAQLLEFQQALIGLSSKIATVQQENATLRNQKDDAEAELKRMKDWEHQKSRYKLVAPFPGCMVYALQKAVSGGEPPHYICAACFENGKRSVLQGMETGVRRKKDSVGQSLSVYACPECKSEATTDYMNVPRPEYFEDLATPS